jgi:hypothetical protein
VAGRTPTFDSVESVHEIPFTQQRTHTARRATVPSGNADALQLFYPTRAGASPPVIADIGTSDGAGLLLVDADNDRRVVAHSDTGTMELVDEYLDGRLRLAYGEGVSSLSHGAGALIETASPGTLGVRMGDDRVDVVAQTADDSVLVRSVGFEAARVDGACGFDDTADGARVRVNRERRFTIRADGGNTRPGADAGATRRVSPGEIVTLDGSASCDADGDALQPSWELVSAPAGSTWSLTGVDTMQPRLHADRVGPYRVRLTVTDSHGTTSLEQEVLIVAGPRCGDGVDDDLDGRIDTDDGDCDGIDHDDNTISTAPASVVEGDAGTARSMPIAVTLSRPSTSPVTVRYRVEPDGSADSADFKPKSGTVTFKPNAVTGLTPTTKYISVPLFPDRTVEGDETFRVRLSEPSAGYAIARAEAVGTIIDDDPQADVRVSVGDVSIVEGDEGVGNKARVRITLDRPATELRTVRLTLAPGSADGSDFKQVKTRTVVFKPGQRQKSIIVSVVPDTNVDAALETVVLHLSDPSAGLAIGRGGGAVTIVDDD